MWSFYCSFVDNYGGVTIVILFLFLCLFKAALETYKDVLEERQLIRDRILYKKTWQDEKRDGQMRRRILRNMTVRRYSNCKLDCEDCKLDCEEWLYYNAASRKEYLNLRSLKRRQESWIYKNYKHKKPHRNTRRLPMIEKGFQASEFILNNNEDLMSHIYSFLQMKEKIRLQQVNSFAFHMLFLVDNFEFKLVHVHHLSQNFSRYKRLRRLTIFDDYNPKPENKPDAEDVVVELAAAIEAGHLKFLTDLSLIDCLIDPNSTHSINVLIKALETGQCPALESLNLRGHCGRDDLAVDVAALLTSGACRNLKHVFLEQNFIGEKGGNALAKALAHPSCRLENLSLWENILTDRIVHEIADGRGKSQETVFIFLSGNFIPEDEGVNIKSVEILLYCDYG